MIIAVITPNRLRVHNVQAQMLAILPDWRLATAGQQNGRTMKQFSAGSNRTSSEFNSAYLRPPAA
jgi:hypothetical protein